MPFSATQLEPKWQSLSEPTFQLTRLTRYSQSAAWFEPYYPNIWTSSYHAPNLGNNSSGEGGARTRKPRVSSRVLRPLGHADKLLGDGQNLSGDFTFAHHSRSTLSVFDVDEMMAIGKCWNEIVVNKQCRLPGRCRTVRTARSCRWPWWLLGNRSSWIPHWLRSLRMTVCWESIGLQGSRCLGAVDQGKKLICREINFKSH